MLSEYKNTLFHEAALKGDTRLLEKCWTERHNISAKNFYGETPLHLACQHDDPKAARQLLRYQANINEFDRQGLTPLHHASIYNRLDIVQLLMKSGADVTLKGKNGNGTAIEVARLKGNQAIVDKLQKHTTSKESTPFLSQSKTAQAKNEGYFPCDIL